MRGPGTLCSQPTVCPLARVGSHRYRRRSGRRSAQLVRVAELRRLGTGECDKPSPAFRGDRRVAPRCAHGRPAPPPPPIPRRAPDSASPLVYSPYRGKVRFAPDSALEGDGFELAVPRKSDIGLGEVIISRAREERVVAGLKIFCWLPPYSGCARSLTWLAPLRPGCASSLFDSLDHFIVRQSTEVPMCSLLHIN
jgi:hypothetical protein